LSPLQVEVLSESPSLIQIYNVLTEAEIAEILRETEPELKKSKVFDSSSTEGRKVSRDRTSLNTWLREENVPDLYHKISRKIEFITGLEVVSRRSAEILQIASYSFGGHYSVHLDAVGKL
jgi:hypothetical protein